MRNPVQPYERAMTDTRLRHAALAASPWVVDARALGLTKRQGPGLAHRLDLTAPAPEHTSTAVVSVAPGTDIHVTGLLESVSEGVLASGTATTTVATSCARCLRELTLEVDASFRELYAYPDSATAQTTGDDEVPRLAGDTIDLGPLLHDELVLAMPTAPVCSPDCRGLCPDCGEPWDALGDDHRHETLDPRWAALTGLVHAEPEAVSGTRRADRAGDDEFPDESTGEPAGDIEEK